MDLRALGFCGDGVALQGVVIGFNPERHVHKGCYDRSL